MQRGFTAELEWFFFFLISQVDLFLFCEVYKNEEEFLVTHLSKISFDPSRQKLDPSSTNQMIDRIKIEPRTHMSKVIGIHIHDWNIVQ